MEDAKIKQYLKKLKLQYGPVYTPIKYFKGLTTLKNVKTRFLRIRRGIKNPNDFSKFSTDKNSSGKPLKTKKSTYTTRFYKRYPGAVSLIQKARATKVPLSIIKQVYNKGLAAWRTGHRPGATGQQWGYARVHSFLTRGKTTRTADKSLVMEAKKKMKPENFKKIF